MLTCKVGNTIINCFDGTFDKHTLKEWSEKNRLICPDCGKSYEYCHGKIVNPYFRHKEKSECEGSYHEPETEEHIKGKIALYNWLLSLQEHGLIQNVKLEAYIPETRQRPDLYFEKDEQRFVIEYQCSPIASEYLERHELYQLAKVNDIWVLGTKNYGLIFGEDKITHKERFKTIEEHTKLYFNVFVNEIISTWDIFRNYLPYKKYWMNYYQTIQIDNITIDFDNKTFKPTDSLLNDVIEKDKLSHQESVLEGIRITECQKIVNEIVVELNEQYKLFKNGLYFFEIGNGYHGNYISRVHFNKNISNARFLATNIYSFFIKLDCTDCCIEYEYSKPFRGKRGGLGWGKCTGYKKICFIDYNDINKEVIKTFILKTIQKYLRSQIYRH